MDELKREVFSTIPAEMLARAQLFEKIKTLIDCEYPKLLQLNKEEG